MYFKSHVFADIPFFSIVHNLFHCELFTSVWKSSFINLLSLKYYKFGTYVTFEFLNVLMHVKSSRMLLILNLALTIICCFYNFSGYNKYCVLWTDYWIWIMCVLRVLIVYYLWKRFWIVLSLWLNLLENYQNCDSYKEEIPI